MNRRALKLALACSLALNVGIIGALAYRSLVASETPQADAEPAVTLAERLALTPAQRMSWEAAEARFLSDLAADTTAVHAHRTRLVEAIFAATPDPAAIEAERQTIARLQQQQQQRVIEQLLAERQILDAPQRARLAEILLQQRPGAGPEQLHRK